MSLVARQVRSAAYGTASVGDAHVYEHEHVHVKYLLQPATS
jgi:hypothetical protein